MDIKDLVADITLDYLQSTPAGDAMRACVERIQQAEETLGALTSGTEDPSLTLLKALSILSAAVFKNMGDTGLMPEEFDQETWAGIADRVVDDAILADGKTYTESVFRTYAVLIDRSVQRWEGLLAPDAIESVKEISESLKGLSDDLGNDEIAEPDYVERCLWLCLEAMVKLLTAYGTLKAKDDDVGALVRATADFAVQYTRLKMYEWERDLLDEYLLHQGEVDEELRAKLGAYIEELGARSAEFGRLIDDAFSPDFRDTLRASSAFAEAAGVPKDQILDTQAKVDDYFL